MVLQPLFIPITKHIAQSSTMMTTIAQRLRRYIAPFYPVNAEEIARFQRWILGEIIFETEDTTVTDGEFKPLPCSSPCSSRFHTDIKLAGPGFESAETTNRVAAIQKQLNRTEDTVSEMDRHLVRCRQDIDGLFVTWSEKITEECCQKVDEKVAEFDKTMERFDKTLDGKCEQAGHTAAAYMQAVIDKHNAKLGQANEQTGTKIRKLEKKIDEKASLFELAKITTEQANSRKRLERFQQKQKDLYEKRGIDLAQVMEDLRNMSAWVKSIEKEHDSIASSCESNAKARRVLERRLNSHEQHPRLNHSFSQALTSASQDVPFSRDLGVECCSQNKAQMEGLVKKSEDHESRLARLEDAPDSTVPCQRCEVIFKEIEKIKRRGNDFFSKKKLEALNKEFEVYRSSADARYKALEEKLDNLAVVRGEVPAPAPEVDWHMAARLESLEEDKRWSDRVRQLETFGVATPEPVLKHLDYLESRLGISLYERELMLPSSIARSRIAWAWRALEDVARTEAHEDWKFVVTTSCQLNVEAHTIPLPPILHQPKPQQPHPEPSTGQIYKGEVILEPTARVEADSQPTSTNEAVPQTTFHEMSEKDTARMETVGQQGGQKSNGTVPEVHESMDIEESQAQSSQTALHPPAAQSFTINLPSGWAPPVDVPAIDWSAFVSVDLSRKASEFDIDDPSRATRSPAKASHEGVSATLKDSDMGNESVTAASYCMETSDASKESSSSSIADREESIQVAKTNEEPPAPMINEDKTSDLSPPRKLGIQSPFSVIPRTNNIKDTTTITEPEQEGHQEPIAQPLYGGDASSAYTTVIYNMTGPLNILTKNSTEQSSVPDTSNRITGYTPAYPSPTNPSSQSPAGFGTTVVSTPQATRGLMDGGFLNFVPVQPSITTDRVPHTQQTVQAEKELTGTSSAPLPEAKVRGNAADSDVEEAESEPDPEEEVSAGVNFRAVFPKPKGRLGTMTADQRKALRLEINLQRHGSNSTQEPSPSITGPSTAPMPLEPPTQKAETISAQEGAAGASKGSSAISTIQTREDEVDYGDSDDESPPPPSKPSAAITPIKAGPEPVMKRYSTQWLKIWRSHVVSEQNLRRFAQANGFENSGDKWVAAVQQANAKTSPADMLSQANIGVNRQLYSRDDINDIADAFFEVCLVQHGSFRSAIEKFDAFRLTDYHDNFQEAFKKYFEDHPADSF